VFQDVLPSQSMIHHKPEHRSFQDDEDPVTKKKSKSKCKITKFPNISKYLHSKHLCECSSGFMKTSYDMFISCFQLISITFPRKLMKIAYSLYENNLTLFYLV